MFLKRGLILMTFAITMAVAAFFQFGNPKTKQNEESPQNTVSEIQTEIPQTELVEEDLQATIETTPEVEAPESEEPSALDRWVEKQETQAAIPVGSTVDQDLVEHFEREIARVEASDSLSFTEEFRKEVDGMDQIKASEVGQWTQESKDN